MTVVVLIVLALAVAGLARWLEHCDRREVKRLERERHRCPDCGVDFLSESELDAHLATRVRVKWRDLGQH